MRLTFRIFSKTGVTMFWYLTSQTGMFFNCTENALSKNRKFVMQLLEASSVHRDEIADNHRGDLRTSNTLISIILGLTLGVSQKSVLCYSLRNSPTFTFIGHTTLSV